MARPLVLVFQEFASLNFTPANADLNTCVAAPAYVIRDYSNAADRAATTRGINYITGGGGYTLPVGGGAPGMQIEYAKAYLNNPVLQIAGGATGSVPAGNPLVTIENVTGTGTSNVRVGDTIRIGASFTSKVREVSEDHETITLSDAYTSSGNVTFDVTRTVPVAYVTTANQGLAVSFDNVSIADEAIAKYDVTTANGVVVEQALLKSATSVTLEYIARRTDLASVQDITSAADVAAKLGKIDTRNPLAVAAYMAVLNSGTTIKAFGVTSDSLEAWGEFEAAIASRSDIYCVVPVSQAHARAVTASLKNRFENQASVDYALENGTPQRFRMVVAGGPGFQPSDSQLLTSTGSATRGTISAGKVVIEFSGGDFVTKGVQPGDLANYGTPGGAFYDYQIDAVLSNQQIRIIVPNSQAAVIPATGGLNVFRRLTVAEAATQYATVPASYASKRCVIVAGMSVDLEGVANGANASTAYLACAVGGMIAGLPPHQGLTNLSISGISAIQGTHNIFDDAQLSKISDGGWCVFIQESPSAAPFCIHGVTTDPSVLEFSEIMSVKNFDYVSESLARQLDRFIGTWNLNDETLGFIRQALEGKLADLRSRKLPKIGAPVIASSITSAGVSTISADRAEVFVELTLPKSLNTIGLHLVSR